MMRFAMKYRLKFGDVFALAALVSCLSLAIIACQDVAPGAQLKLAGQDDKKFELPSGAVIIEEQPLGSKKHPDRALILWMVNPTKNPSDAQKDPEAPYTCPDETRGSCYSGPTRVSLLNTTTRTVINTIGIKDGHFERGEGLEDKADSFAIPYAIRKGYYYHVEGEGDAPEGVEMKARVMWLKDYNGDGRAMEFALFDSAYCMGLLTTLIGYSEWQDRVIQYPIDLEVVGDEGHWTESLSWCDYLFSEKPTSPGQWKYEIDYSGRGGSLGKYEIRYDAQHEMFLGTLVWTADAREKG
jgi:hypothetical protein